MGVLLQRRLVCDDLFTFGYSHSVAGHGHPICRPHRLIVTHFYLPTLARGTARRQAHRIVYWSDQARPEEPDADAQPDVIYLTAFDEGYLPLEPDEISRPAASPRPGRRTARTFPLVPPPQKKRSSPSASSPDTWIPGGISSLSRTFPVSGSRRRRSLWSPSHVACHNSPSFHVTPVTKRLDSMVRRIVPVSGSI